MQAEIQKLKDTREGKVTHSDSNSQAGLQNSNLVPGSGPPPNKQQKTVFEGASEDEDNEEEEQFIDLCCTKYLAQMSEAASTFSEAAFNTKLKNSDRTSHAEKFGVPDSRWLKCLDLDLVVSSTIPAAAHCTNRNVSRLQNY